MTDVAEAPAKRPTSADYKPVFESVNPDEIPAQTRAGKTAELLEAFLEAGIEAAEIKGQSKTFMTSLNNYRKAQEAAGNGNVNEKVVWKSVGGRVFFYNVELMKARKEQEAAEAEATPDTEGSE